MLIEKELVVTTKLSAMWHFNWLSFVSGKCSLSSLFVYQVIQQHPRNLGKQGALCPQVSSFHCNQFGTWTDRAVGINTENGELCCAGPHIRSKMV